MGRRTALINQLRAILLERGITVPQRRRVLETRLPAILADEQAGVSPRVRLLIEDMRAEWRDLDKRIEAFDAELVVTAREDDAYRRLCEIPGIGVLNATALVVAVVALANKLARIAWAVLAGGHRYEAPTGV